MASAAGARSAPDTARGSEARSQQSPCRGTNSPARPYAETGARRASRPALATAACGAPFSQRRPSPSFRVCPRPPCLPGSRTTARPSAWPPGKRVGETRPGPTQPPRPLSPPAPRLPAHRRRALLHGLLRVLHSEKVAGRRENGDGAVLAHACWTMLPVREKRTLTAAQPAIHNVAAPAPCTPAGPPPITDYATPPPFFFNFLAIHFKFSR